MSDKLGFLNQNEQVRLPEGGGDFAPTGFIGKTYAQVLFSFMSQEDSKNHEGLPEYTGRRQAGSWGFIYYYPTRGAADQVMAALDVQGFNGKKPVAKEVWNVQVTRDSVLNFADKSKLDNWSELIALDTQIVTLGSKYRHEFHMLALPLAVQAMAKYLGFTYEPFSVAELIRKPEEMVYSDEFFAQMFGNPDAKKDASDHFKNSTMWLRRAALWESLGEPNYEAYQPKYVVEMDEKGQLVKKISKAKFAISSDQLDQCLQIVNTKWNKPIWTRVITIPDPRVDAVSEKGKRNLLPALYEIFGDEATARAAAKVDLERFAGNGNGAAKNLPIPAAYVGEYEQMWKDNVAKVKAEFATKPALPVVAAQAKGLGVTPEELVAWAWN